MIQDLDKEKVFLEACASGTFQFSYSSLNRLIFSPQLFYKDYILKDREERTDKHLIQGKLIHLLLLQPEEFDNQFVLLPAKLPSESLRKVLKLMPNHTQEKELSKVDDTVILDCLHEVNLYQSLKDADKRVAKVRTPECEDYYRFLSTTNKNIIDVDTLEKCKESVELIKDNEKVQKLLQDEPTDFEMDDIEVYNEIPLECNLDNYDFGLKGIIDRYVVDHKNKIIKIIDFKTTGKTITEFPETVQFYNYWLQAAVYMTLVTKNLSEKEADYQIIFNFIVIDKYNQIYSFPVRTSTMSEWGDAMTGVFETATYHVNENNYSLPQQFLIDDMTL